MSVVRCGARTNALCGRRGLAGYLLCGVGHKHSLLCKLAPLICAKKRLFNAAYGEIVEVKLHKKGAYGFVRYAQHADAVKAIVSTHSTTIEGRVGVVFFNNGFNGACGVQFSTAVLRHRLHGPRAMLRHP